MIDRALAALHEVSLIDGHVAAESDGFRLQIENRAVGENLHAVVALDLDGASEAQAGLDVALDPAALVVDLELRGHHRLKGSGRSHADVRCRDRRDRVHSGQHARVRWHLGRQVSNR